MLAAAFAPNGAVFMAAVFAGGASTCAIQMLVPMAAFMAAPSRRGATVGNVMSGLLVGVLLSRPLSNLVVDVWGWRVLYLVFAAAMARSEEHTSELQSLMRISYAVFCLKKKKKI